MDSSGSSLSPSANRGLADPKDAQECQALRDAVEFLIRRAEQQAHVAEMIRATMLGHYRQANSTAAAQSPTREATDNDHPHGEANDFVSPMPAETPQCELSPLKLLLPAEPVDKLYDDSCGLPFLSPMWGSRDVPETPLKRKLSDLF
ncbi:hypothetical protein Pmar_PMAR008555 [Perkinsus marinus ATCC 50983]|uniref:Uncharacterized protein n=1 Tax=Perkinsus marinus (strain ATCC 50983 / TXsc) TaxID=423536 RepID=C5KIK8_PERM5|nr:hypothetical protein Pmar_PMAR019540 [Perkinsus marinus ATCC 50983]XP_002783889.1 hypothetical protein Pmar_PMAR008555 [Perkinsus marinus ATCC 50983]EER13011.1 hypothetical protein Pmar_PMAR019540 [Perkinsus marinus ATCC 50983]EER15685.1 hypothetical protein Pmar_PMAR008555 [Perkinsus marinus ATCC 50983]|eukprot:XP_002781216.1 hypothetical protein Pmar_PMAR019540 [Perkinsus marinus ATCC 50983]